MIYACACLYPTFQAGIAKICIEHKTDMIHADYLLPDMQELDVEAKIQGVTIFCEMGLDPGLDHIAYIILKEDIEKAGEKIREVRSYGRSQQDNNNLLGYKFSWAGKGGFVYYCREAIMVV